MDFVRGDTKDLAFKIKQDDTYITLDDCSEIEVQINPDSNSNGKNIKKLLSKGQITFNETDNTFHTLLSQIDTFNCVAGTNSLQIRIMRGSGVTATTTANLTVGDVLSSKVLSLNDLLEKSVNIKPVNSDNSEEIVQLKAEIAKLRSENQLIEARMQSSKDEEVNSFLSKFRTNELAKAQKVKEDELRSLEKVKNEEIARIQKSKYDEIARIQNTKESELENLEKIKNEEIARLQRSKSEALSKMEKEKDDIIAILRKQINELKANIKDGNK